MKIANPFERFGITQADYDGTENYGRFVIEPLERGFGQTLGNSLRRVLLSSLPGASLYAVEVEGARHEFTALEGVENANTVYGIAPAAAANVTKNNNGMGLGFKSAKENKTAVENFLKLFNIEGVNEEVYF